LTPFIVVIGVGRFEFRRKIGDLLRFHRWLYFLRVLSSAVSWDDGDDWSNAGVRRLVSSLDSVGPSDNW